MSAPIRFLSVCSGIEAASVEHGASKPCSHCKQIKSLDDFHKSAKGKLKRASWCKPCMNAITREGRKRTYSSENKRKWQIKTRYGITCEQVDAILSGQSGRCGICAKELTKYHIDHNHLTGEVRGILCHRCNLVIGGLDDPAFRVKALNWLEGGSK